MKEEPETEEQLAEHFLHTMVMVAASIEGDISQIGRISSAAIHTRQAVRKEPKKLKACHLFTQKYGSVASGAKSRPKCLQIAQQA